MTNEFMYDVYTLSAIDGNPKGREEADRDAAEAFARLMESAREASS